MESVLDTLGTYFMQNGMCVNTSKTELLFAGRRQQLAATHRSPSVQLIGATLKPVTQVKNLRLIMDSNLTYEPHIDSVIKRCNGILIGLLYARHVLPRELLLVSALALSHLRYCCTIYGNSSSATSMKRLQKVINFGARVVSGRRKFEHTYIRCAD